MQRNTRDSNVSSLPAPPATPSAPGYFSPGNPATGVPATVPGYDWFNAVQEELVNVIQSAGLTLDASKYDQLLQAIRIIGAAPASGTADAITASYTPAISTLNDRMRLHIRAGAANATTTPTFTPNSGVIPAKAIVKGAGQPLVAGDIAGAGHWLQLVYDQTLDKWVLLNPARGLLRQGLAAWANFDGTLGNGGITPRASFGIAAITKTGVGAYTVTLSNAMADANYVVMIDGNSNSQVDSRDITSRTTTSFSFATASNSVFANWPTVALAVIGNL